MDLFEVNGLNASWIEDQGARLSQLLGLGGADRLLVFGDSQSREEDGIVQTLDCLRPGFQSMTSSPTLFTMAALKAKFSLASSLTLNFLSL